MASGLYNLQASITRNLIQCIKHSCDISTSHKSRWRTISSLSLVPGMVTETFEPKQTESRRITSLRDLKKKETGDWRNLSLEEKRTLYSMSFSQPLHYAVDQPADEWKVILAGTFTAMGFMMIGMYLWASKAEHAESDIGPLSSKNKEEIRIPFGERMESLS